MDKYCTNGWHWLPGMA